MNERLEKLKQKTAIMNLFKNCVQIPVKRCAHSEINGVAIPM